MPTRSLRALTCKASRPASSRISTSIAPSRSDGSSPAVAAHVAAMANEGWGRRRVGTIRHLGNLLLSVALTFLGLTCVTFFIGRVIPIDPVLAIVGDKASVETYTRVRAEIGLDLPIPIQFWRYLVKVLHGDFGSSVVTSQPVLHDLLHVFPANLELSVLALIIGVVLGIPLGVIAATHRG